MTRPTAFETNLQSNETVHGLKLRQYHSGLQDCLTRPRGDSAKKSAVDFPNVLRFLSQKACVAQNNTYSVAVSSLETCWSPRQHWHAWLHVLRFPELSSDQHSSSTQNELPIALSFCRWVLSRA
jgi:hypothetical protein